MSRLCPQIFIHGLSSLIQLLDGLTSPEAKCYIFTPQNHVGWSFSLYISMDGFTLDFKNYC